MRVDDRQPVITLQEDLCILRSMQLNFLCCIILYKFLFKNCKVMAPTRKIINMMKEMENNIKTHIQETIEEALKRQEIKFNNKIDEVFSKLKDQENKKNRRCNKKSEVFE